MTPITKERRAMPQMTAADVRKAQALQMAIDYHRVFEAGVGAAMAQKAQTFAPQPGRIVDTAKMFLTFLGGK